MRVRQFVVVARDLESVVADFEAVLGIEVGFNDPQVKEFGLRNAVLPVGDAFLEVVSPIDPSATAERYLKRRGGDGGYMLIVQCDDLDHDRARLDKLGVRTVWKLDLPNMRGTHLHPKDTGGTLLSLDDAKPAESWLWAGPKWESHVRREVVSGIAAAELQSDDPAALGRRWSEVLGKPLLELAPKKFAIALDASDVRFVEETDGRGEGLTAFDVKVVDREKLLAGAKKRGCKVEGDEVTVAGIRVCLV
jgi:hypothetical protein